MLSINQSLSLFASQPLNQEAWLPRESLTGNLASHQGDKHAKCMDQTLNLLSSVLCCVLSFAIS